MQELNQTENGYGSYFICNGIDRQRINYYHRTTVHRHGKRCSGRYKLSYVAFVGVNYSDTISIARQQAEAYNSIDRVKVSDGTAIFYCFNDIPLVSLDIQIKMVY